MPSPPDFDEAASVSLQSDAVLGIGIGAVVIGIVFVALIAVGFLLLVRRRRTLGAPARNDDLARRANIALVRLDDAVTASADELDFAIAQFGEKRAEPLAAAVREARASLAGAFAVKQQLDDAQPDSVTKQKEWRSQIVALCESSMNRLTRELAAFDALRTLERSAPQNLDAVRVIIEDARGRLPGITATLATLSKRFTAPAVAPVSRNPAEAAQLIEDAAAHANEAAEQIDDTGTGAASSLIQSADREARRAMQLLDDVESLARALAASSGHLKTLVADTRAIVADAKLVRDDPPDPETGAAIAAEIAQLEHVIAATRSSHSIQDPDAAIARISAAADALDAALAGARNQQQRLDHARTALAGALLTARSQIETTRAYIGGRRGGAGAEARTRLAEAERLLAIAEAETDPVIALDTARSSATHSRDADALARYDLLH